MEIWNILHLPWYRRALSFPTNSVVVGSKKGPDAYRPAIFPPDLSSSGHVVADWSTLIILILLLLVMYDIYTNQEKHFESETSIMKNRYFGRDDDS